MAQSSFVTAGAAFNPPAANSQLVPAQDSIVLPDVAVQAQALSRTGAQSSASASSDYHSDVFVIERLLNARATATLVQVKAVTNSPGQVTKVGQVDVLPLINQIDGNGNPTPHQIVHGLPYFRFQGGSNAVLCDPQIGDIGLAVFCQHDISNVKSNMSQSNPGSRRRNDWADGIYFGLCIGGGTPNQYISFTNNGITIQDKNGNSIVMSSSGIKLNGKSEFVNDVTMDGKLNVTGDTTVNNIIIQGTETGGGPS